MPKTIDDFKNKIICGDCLEVLKQIPDNFVDCIITDPPAGIGFMNKKWDKFRDRDDFISWLQKVAEECLRVLKPGGHALVWALPRTSHWTATAWENAGFEVRDRIIYVTSKQELLNQFLETLNEDQKKLFWILMDESRVEHCFGSGFPKSYNIGKGIESLIKQGNSSWTNWKKLEGEEYKNKTGYVKFQTEQKYRNDYSNSVSKDIFLTTEQAKQWEGWGTALKPAIEDWWLLRKPLSEKTIAENVLKWGTGGLNIEKCRVEAEKQTGWMGGKSKFWGMKDGIPRPVWGRFPSHLIIDDSEEVKSLFPNSKGWSSQNHNSFNPYGGNALLKSKTKRQGFYEGYNDSGSASRFFYVAKASRRERDIGLGESERNNHPTVKPIKLMEYLIQLICPPNGIVLDPFLGSGTTALAAKMLGRTFIGIEKSPEYCEIAERRLKMISKPVV